MDAVTRFGYNRYNSLTFTPEISRALWSVRDARTAATAAGRVTSNKTPHTV